MVLLIAFVASAGAGTGKRAEILLLDGGCRRSSTTTRATTYFVCSGHCSMEGGQVAHHTVIQLLFVRVNGLGMLAQVVKTRELFRAVTRKGPFAGVFPLKIV